MLMNFLSLQRCGSVAHVCIEYLAMTDARHSPAELSTAELYKRRDIDRPAVTATVRRESLKLTGKFCGGLRDDWARRGHWVYLSDWSDCFTGENFQKTVAAILFLFFACFAPAVAFGG